MNRLLQPPVMIRIVASNGGGHQRLAESCAALRFIRHVNTSLPAKSVISCVCVFADSSSLTIRRRHPLRSNSSSGGYHCPPRRRPPAAYLRRASTPLPRSPPTTPHMSLRRLFVLRKRVAYTRMLHSHSDSWRRQSIDQLRPPPASGVRRRRLRCRIRV